MSQVGILNQLEEGEEILHESSICDLEFDKQEDTIRKIIGEKIRGRVICQPYLTNKRLLTLLLVAPDRKDMEPKSGWYSFPHSRLRNHRSNVRRRRYDKQGLELEYVNLTLRDLLAGKETTNIERGSLGSIISGVLGGDRTKLWLLVPDSQIWNYKISEIMGKI